MVRRKGETTPRRIDQEYPHQIEIPIPEGGLTNIYEIDAFCRECGFNYAKRGIGKLRRQRGSDATRYCFTDPAHAESFLAAFGGERVALSVKKPPAQSIGRRGLWSKRRA